MLPDSRHQRGTISFHTLVINVRLDHKANIIDRQMDNQEEKNITDGKILIALSPNIPISSK